jgi:hypothetical protein
VSRTHSSYVRRPAILAAVSSGVRVEYHLLAAILSPLRTRGAPLAVAGSFLFRGRRSAERTFLGWHVGGSRSVSVEQIYPDLWQTATEHPVPESPDGVANAYLLVRPAGNVLFYSTGREAIGPVNDADELRHSPAATPGSRPPSRTAVMLT